MISLGDFLKIDIRSGTVVRAELFPEAKKPAFKLWVDFGQEIGIKKSSAQITEHYKIDQLIGKQVVGVVNFPPKQIANFVSEVLITGFPDKNGKVILCSIDQQVANGSKLF